MTRPFGSAPAWALLLIASLLVAPTAAQPPPPAVAGTDVAPPPGAALPLDVTLRDLHGGTLATRALLRGRPVVLVFAYSDCPMLCSLVLRGLARAVRDAEARPEVDYALVTVSIDPDEPPAIARRTQSRLLALAGQSDHPGSWQYLLGEERAIGRLTAALGFRYRYDEATDQYAHPAAVFVLTPDGRLSAVLEELDHAPGALDEAVADARAGAVEEASLVDAVLRCFRFDPADRRYGSAIVLALRTLAVVVLAGFGAGFWLLRRRRS